MHPVLLPAARQLWRDGSSLQLGQGYGRAAVLGGLDPAAKATLRLLDGTRDLDQVVRAASAHGCPPARARELLDLLDAAGLLADGDPDRSGLSGISRQERERLSPDLASLALVRADRGGPAVGLRRAVEVLVVGAGRIGVPVALTLAAAGVGRVDITDEGITRPQDTGVGGLGPADVGRPRGRAARELLRRTVPTAGNGPVTRPHLVVLACAAGEARERSRALVLEGTPHLLAHVRETAGVVGPLVLPGRTPCVRCLDLTRTDLDPVWPVLAAQLAVADPDEPCDGALALAVAAQAAAQVLGLVDGPAGSGGHVGAAAVREGTPAGGPAAGAPAVAGPAAGAPAAGGPGPGGPMAGRPGPGGPGSAGPEGVASAAGRPVDAGPMDARPVDAGPVATLGGTLEMALPDWRWRRRSWPVHPDCGCVPTDPLSGPRAAAGPPGSGRSG